MLKKNIRFVLLVVLTLTACASRGDKVSVNEIWARPSDSGMNSAVYFAIDNPTNEDESLLEVHGSIAEGVELHKSKQSEEGAMMMEPQESVPIPARETVLFQPGGLHVMLLGLKKDLKVGDSFPLVLQFAHVGDIQIEVTVLEP